MAYRLRITTLALGDIDEVVAHLFRHASPRTAQEWLEGIEATAGELTEMPRSLPLAPENEDVEFEVRQSHYGVYRLLFMIEGEEIVVVLRVYHGMRRQLRSDELER